MRDREFLPALLIEQRVSRGLSQRACATRCGVSRGYLSELELGWHQPTDLFLAKLAAGLGCHARDLSRPRAAPPAASRAEAAA